MKKEIRPPENWQDFETLCKRLFGEVWNCALTIKKNGRLGQPQCGIDVYGKPKGENAYWGVQCKGKDNYTNSKLTEKEIEEEIEKAKTFEPQLHTLVFATTAPKDAVLEAFVRKKDLESCATGGFQILLYCWQDLADLIDGHRDTFNWYVNESQFKQKFEVKVEITTRDGNNTLYPKFLKTITNYKLKPPPKPVNYDLLLPDYLRRLNNLSTLPAFENKPFPSFGASITDTSVNHSFCSLNVTIVNTGTVVLEDWKMRLDFEGDIREVDDDFESTIFNFKEAIKYRTTWKDNDNKSVSYYPLDNSPLIQKDSRFFNAYCIPGFDCKEIKVRWHLLARDFDQEGEFTFSIHADYEVKTSRILLRMPMKSRFKRTYLNTLPEIKTYLKA